MDVAWGAWGNIGDEVDQRFVPSGMILLDPLSETPVSDNGGQGN